MWIAIDLSLILLNGYLAWYNYDNENYDAAIFNSFACGFVTAFAIATALIQ